MQLSAPLMKYLPLTQKRIAVAGARRFDDLQAIIEKQGGEAILRSMMSSSDHDEAEVEKALKTFAARGTDWLILVTGVGTKALLEKAEGLGLAVPIKQHMDAASLAIRGYKTLNVLKTLGLKPEVIDDDGTVEGLRRELEPFDFSGKRITVQLHGERMPELTDWLISRGAEVLEVPLYFYNPPAEDEVKTLLYELLSAQVDAVAFTSNTQVHFFFEAVERLAALSYVQAAFADSVIALSVGSMTSKALSSWGITRIVAPEHERMGAMIMALAQYFERTKPEKVQLPIMLTQLTRVLVVGGGKVAERKVKSLLESGVFPRLVSPDLTPDLQGFVQEGRLEYLAKPFLPEDLHNVQLVIAATNDSKLNSEIAQEALSKGLLCNVVDQPELGNFTTLASIRRGDLSVSIASDGTSPAFSKYLKQKLEQHFPEIYSTLMTQLGLERQRLAELSEEQRAAFFDALCSRERLDFFGENPEQIPTYFKQSLSDLKEKL
ncbi:MAG: uroporphyrinogen-III synthase [Trueperaceae bacterium]|nr:uroporphyrinogen-III synthase [Trueperaceae bacterium]